MNYSEFRRHLGKAGMTVNLFASYLGANASSVSNHAKSGKVPRSYAILAVLLGDLADRKIHVADLLSNFDIHPIVGSDVLDANVHQLEMFRNIRKSNFNNHE